MSFLTFSNRFRFKITFSTDCDADCTFQRNNWTPFGMLNECLVQDVEIESRGESLLSVKTFGNSDDDYDCCSVDSDEYDDDDDSWCYDVKSFYVYQSPMCNYVPSAITNHFRNLTILVIAHGGLKEVTKADLKPFKQLKGLYLDNNKLAVLEEDLFVHNPKLQEINFSKNQLSHIAHNILDSLIFLNKAGFYSNRCINLGAESADQVKVLKIALMKKFQPRIHKLFVDNIDDILESCKALYESEKEK